MRRDLIARIITGTIFYLSGWQLASSLRFAGAAACAS
jgi:hypothetical protein